MNEQLRASALRFAREAIKDIETPSDVNAKQVARYMVAFHAFELEKAKTPDPAVEHALRRIQNPVADLPVVVERISQALELLKYGAPQSEDIFIARTVLEDALRLMGRSDLT